MALASTSLVQVRYIAEVTPGTTPTSGQNYDLRVTGESFDYAIQKEISKEINSSRVTSSESPVSATTSGGVQAELSYNEYDHILASLMQSSWTVYGTAGVQGTGSTADFATGTITASAATSGADSWATLKKGQWFRITCATSANNGRLFRVSSSVAPTTTVITLDASTPAAAATSVASVKVQTSRLTHGTTQTSFSIERQALDVGQYFVYKGQTPSKLSLNIASGALSTMSIDFTGLGVDRDTSTNLTGSTNNPSTAYKIHSGVSNSASFIWEGGAPNANTYVKSCAIEFDNALRSQSAIGSLAPVAIASGTIMAKATLQVYFADGDLFDKFVANTTSSLMIASLDSDGNGYVISAPVANVSTFKITAGAKDQDLMADITMTLLADTGNADAALRKVLFIDRVGVAVTRA